MRVRIIVDSATPVEIEQLTRAYQHTRDHHESPASRNDAPTINIIGQGWGWESPHLTVQHVADLTARVAP